MTNLIHHSFKNNIIHEGVLKLHKRKVVLSCVYFFLTIICILISFISIKNKLETKSNNILKLKIAELKLNMKQYDLLDLQTKDILKKISTIDKRKLLIVNFTNDNFAEIVNNFNQSMSMNIVYVKQDESCTTRLPLINSSQAKCAILTFNINGTSQESSNIIFDKYIQKALPGFLFPLEILVNKSDNNSLLKYNELSKYYWIYFTSV